MATGSTMGRPVIHTEKKLKEYVDGLIEWLEAKDENLFFIDYCKEKGLSQSLFYGSEPWMDNLYFSENIQKAKDIIAQKLAKSALYNKTNPIFTMFMLKARHQWNDKAGEQQMQLPPVNIMVNLPPASITPSELSDTPYTIIQPIQIQKAPEDPT